MRTIERRLELLRLEGLGFNLTEIVQQLSKKYEVTTRTVQYDFKRRASWQPGLQQIINNRDLLLKVENRLEQIFRRASVKFTTSQNENVQLGALKVMLEATLHLSDVALLTDIESRLQQLEGESS